MKNPERLDPWWQGKDLKLGIILKKTSLKQKTFWRKKE
jgi:hypothetical protein